MNPNKSTVAAELFSREGARAWLRAEIATVLGVGPDDIDVNAPILDYGIDSMQVADFTEHVGEAFALALPDTFALDHATIDEMASHLVSRIQSGAESHRAAGAHAGRAT